MGSLWAPDSLGSVSAATLLLGSSLFTTALCCTDYKTGNVRVVDGGSNVIENVDSGYSMSRGLWAQTTQLVVSGGAFHHNNVRHACLTWFQTSRVTNPK